MSTLYVCRQVTTLIIHIVFVLFSQYTSTYIYSFLLRVYVYVFVCMQYMETQVSEGRAKDIKCASCTYLVSPVEARYCLSKQQFARYEQLLFDAHLRQDPGIYDHHDDTHVHALCVLMITIMLML